MKFKNCRIVGANIDTAAYLRQDAQRGTAEFAMSPSAIKSFLENPRRWVLGYSSPASPSKDWGNIIDTMTISPEKFADRYVVKPETYAAPADHDKVKKGEIDAGDPLPWNANAKVCKDWERHNLRDREAISSEEYKMASEAHTRLLGDETINRFFADSLKQVMVVGEAEFGKVRIPVRCLIDLQPTSDGEFSSCLGDLKTSRNASRRSFTRFSHDMGYHIQAAFDLDLFNAATGEQRDTWCLIVQESYRPFETAKHMLSQRFLGIGRMQYASALEKYAICPASGCEHKNWPGYNDHADAVQGWSILEPEPWMESIERVWEPISATNPDDSKEGYWTP